MKIAALEFLPKLPFHITNKPSTSIYVYIHMISDYIMSYPNTGGMLDLMLVALGALYVVHHIHVYTSVFIQFYTFPKQRGTSR